MIVTDWTGEMDEMVLAACATNSSLTYPEEMHAGARSTILSRFVWGTIFSSINAFPDLRIQGACKDKLLF